MSKQGGPYKQTSGRKRRKGVGVRLKTLPKSMWPNPRLRYGKRRMKGIDYGIKEIITNSFQPVINEPPPKGGYPNNDKSLPRTTKNSRRG